MGKVSKETIIRTVILFVTIINSILTIMGKNPLPFSEEDVYTSLSAIAAGLASLWAWWKNNDFTEPAIKAGEYLKELKKGE